MTLQLKFATDKQANEFCELIVAEMCRLFGISLDEAVMRVNRHWQGQEIIGEDDVVYHEDETFWAKQIYYDDTYSWWLENPPTPMKVRKLQEDQ